MRLFSLDLVYFFMAKIKTILSSLILNCFNYSHEFLSQKKLKIGNRCVVGKIFFDAGSMLHFKIGQHFN